MSPFMLHIILIVKLIGLARRIDFSVKSDTTIFFPADLSYWPGGG